MLGTGVRTCTQGASPVLMLITQRCSGPAAQDLQDTLASLEPRLLFNSILKGKGAPVNGLS